MKTYLYFLLALMPFLMASCNNADDQPQFSTPEEDLTDMIEMPISIAGEVVTEYEELSRGTSTNDLIGIQVYWKSGNSWYMFAHGIFDHLDNLKVFLKKEYTYSIKATIIKDGKTLFGTLDKYYNYFPFYSYYSTYYGIDLSTLLTTNYLTIYRSYSNDDRHGLYYLDDANVDNTSNYPQVDRLYCALEEIVPEVGGNITLDMKRVSFGLKVQVSGVEEGSLNVTINNNSKTFVSSSGLTSGYDSGDQLWQFSSVTTPYERYSNYYETLTLDVSHYHSSINVTEDLGSTSINIYRNKMNIVKINLSQPAISAPARNAEQMITMEYEDL